MAVLQNRRNVFGFILCLLLLMTTLFSFVQPAYADVEEVETEIQQISKTEPGDGSGGQTDGGGGELTWRDKIGNIIANIGDWGKDVITDVGSTLSNEWKNFTEWVDNSWVGDARDWVKDNKTIQTITAAIIATAVIVGGIALLVVTFPAWGSALAITWGTVAIIGGFALAGGLLYQWIAGDNYSFGGALGSSFLGGIIGYVGAASGAFGAGWGWLKSTAVPFVVNWGRNKAIPWVVGHARGAWSWLRTKGTAAWGWLKTKGTAAWNGFKGFLSSYGSRFATLYGGPNKVRNLLLGPGLGLVGGVASTVVSSLMSGEVKPLNLVTDIIAGGVSGLVLGPFVLGGQMLKLSTLIGLPIYGGVEGYITDGIKDGEWDTSLNFFLGMGASFFSITSIGVIADLILKDKVAAEMGASAAEEWMKNTVKDAITGGGESEAPSEQPSNTKQSQTNNSSKSGNGNNSGTETQSSGEKNSSSEPKSNTNQSQETSEKHQENGVNETTQEMESTQYPNVNTTPSMN